MLFHEVHLLVALVESYLLPGLLKVIAVNRQEVRPFCAFDCGETWLAVDQGQLTEGARALQTSDIDHSFFIQITDFDRLSCIQKTINVILRGLARSVLVLLGGNQGMRWTAFFSLLILSAWALLIRLILLDVDLIGQERIFFFILLVEYLKEVFRHLLLIVILFDNQLRGGLLDLLIELLGK